MSARIYTAAEAQEMLDAASPPGGCPATTIPCECFAGRKALGDAANDLAASVAHWHAKFVDAAEVGLRAVRERDEERVRIGDELNATLARLAAARKLIASWRHGEDCPAGVHDECMPDAEGDEADCLEGDTLDACRAAKGVCECGAAALRALLGDVPAGDARTLGEARATAEKLRADVAFWRRSSEAASARSVEAAEIRGALDTARYNHDRERAARERAETERDALRAAVREADDAAQHVGAAFVAERIGRPFGAAEVEAMIARQDAATAALRALVSPEVPA